MEAKPRPRAAERGFSVPELLVAMVLLIGIGLATIGVVSAFARAIQQRSSSQGGTVALEDQLESMRSDAAAAYAVFVPEKDVHGAPNAAAPNGGNVPSGHEIDFYSRTDTGTEAWWAYDYNATAQTLQRFDYDAAGHVGVANRKTGAIDTTASYPALTGVKNFTAAVMQANQLTSSPNRFAPVVANLFSGKDTAPESEPVGIIPVSNIARPDLYGGNVAVQVQLSTDRGTRTLHLASAALPSGFTIHQQPAIREVTYRIDQVHRAWFGLEQITHSGIYDQLLYTYSVPADANAKWQLWCDYEVYGAGTTGLRLGGNTGTYHSKDFDESAAGVYYAVTNITSGGVNGTNGLNPIGNCHGAVPGPKDTPAPIPAQTDPDVYDTPPPCFDSGSCWPYNAPANWAPPSPWPSSSPPAAWCATHAESELCGGTGGTPEPAVSEPLPTPNYNPPTPAPVVTPPIALPSVPPIRSPHDGPVPR